jgi:hypothetical protein
MGNCCGPRPRASATALAIVAPPPRLIAAHPRAVAATIVIAGVINALRHRRTDRCGSRPAPRLTSSIRRDILLVTARGVRLSPRG